MKTYLEFVRTTSNYLSRASEDAIAIHNGLTFGCWVYFDAESTNVETGIISKWNTPGDASYLLYKSASNKITFSVSVDGTSVVSIDDLGANYVVGQWFYVVARFTPSVEIALFVNGMWYKSKSGIPATIYHSSEAFEIGRYARDNYLDGRITQAFICAYSVPDRFICAMYSHAKALFMSKNLYPSWCSSSSSSSSSTTSTSSSSSTTSSSSSTTPP